MISFFWCDAPVARRLKRCTVLLRLLQASLRLLTWLCYPLPFLVRPSYAGSILAGTIGSNQSGIAASRSGFNPESQTAARTRNTGFPSRMKAYSES